MSNTSISDIAIKLSVNADGVSKGFRTAAEEARSYKAELDRLVYAVGKNDPVDYNAHVQQFTQATNERLAREKKAQEEFNAWYNKEMDREVAMFIAAETQKEQATQARIAAERQAALYAHNMQQIVQARPLPAESESRGNELLALEEAIRKRYALLDQEQQLIQNQVAMNTRNAQRFQATLEMETAARAQSNAQLQAAITARYAILDTEERAFRDNATNAAAANARKVAAAEQAHQQDLANLRAFIQQKYALLDQEERAVRDNATNLAAAQARAAADAEQVRQQDLRNLKAYIVEKYAAQDRQTNINVFNAQRFQAVPEAETMARALSNDKLEEAIRARYALLDQDERAIRDNAANKAAAMLRANADAQRLHEQDLQNLREYITQKYAILNREEAIEKMNASNAAEIARLKTMRTKQANDAANAQRDADFAAYKADLARQEAEGMINAEKMARIERARQRDAKRAADDDRVRQLNDWRQQQAMMQRAAIDTQLGTARMAGGFGGAAMAIGQASYAAEDFIQVLSMGGGLNMALMSASNNLSMVARSLIGTSSAMVAAAGLGVPALLIGTNLLIQYLSKEEEEVNLVAKAYERLNTEREHTNALASIQSQHAMNMADIDALTTHAQAAAKLASEIKALAKAEEEESAIQDELRMKRNELRDAVAGGTIIADAERSLAALRDMRAEMSPIANFEHKITLAEAEDEIRNLTAAYTEYADAVSQGTSDEIIRSAEELKRVIEESNRVFSAFPENQIAKLAPILGSDEDLARLGEAGKLMRDLVEAQKEIANRKEAEAKAQEATNELLQKEKELRQENTLFQLQATEAQKSEMDIRKQLVEFLGLTNTQPGQLDPTLLMGQSRQEAMDFLEAYNANLARTKQEMLDEQRQITPTGGMEQNAFGAQANALQQMLEANYRKEDPQLRDIDTRIQQSNELLRQITDGPGLVRIP